MIVDFGLSKLQVTIMRLEHGLFKTLASATEEIGGRDIDSRLVEFCLNKIKEEFPDFNPNKIAKNKIREAAI